MFTLHNGDCLEYMKTLAPASVDCVITDPPYGIGVQNKNCVAGRNDRRSDEKITWDEFIPSQEYFDEIFRISKYNKVFKFTQRWTNFVNTKQTDHPTEKPVDLMKYCIELVSKEGETIFDPFMGSGSTGVAAIQTGRRFMGCEISAEYFAIAEKRVKSAVFSPNFFTPSNNRLHLTGGGLPATQSSFTAEVIPPAKLPAKSPRR